MTDSLIKALSDRRNQLQTELDSVNQLLTRYTVPVLQPAVKRVFSEATRRRMALAQKRRWKVAKRG